MNLRIFPPEEMLEAAPGLPLSKSISNRLVIINALTGGNHPLPELSESDDTRVLVDAIEKGSGTVDIDGAGTAMRFLAAYYAATPGCEVTLTGNSRMLSRPVSGLVDALRRLGADVAYAGEEGFPPLKIKGKRLSRGEITIDATVSSQFVSALMMVAPGMEQPLVLNLEGAPVSLPYIRMTLAMMERRGISCDFEDSVITVRPGSYRHIDEPIEADWSAAAAWYEMEALAMGTVSLKGLSLPSIQGDSHVAEIFAMLGVDTDTEGEDGGLDLIPSPDQLPRISLDMSPWPDLVPSVAVTCAMLGIPFHLAGLSTLRLKESDRVEAIATELSRLGIMVTTEPDAMGWELERHPINELPRFSSHGDHRIAMALAPISLFVPGIVIEDAEVVSKSYPGYWEVLTKTGFRLVDGDAPLPEGSEAGEGSPSSPDATAPGSADPFAATF